MRFEDVTPMIESGKRGLRESWKDVAFVYYIPGGEYETQTEIGKRHFGDSIPYDPYLAIQSSNGFVDTYRPSIDDRFSEDWIVLD